MALIMSFVDGEWCSWCSRPFSVTSFGVRELPAADDGLPMTPVMPLS
jgi:hypothetical protein